MKKFPLPVLLVFALGAAGAIWWSWHHSRQTGSELELYGNVDLRDAALAFKREDRITEVLVEEGARVKKGQLLARLDTAHLQLEQKQQEAELTAQNEVVRRLVNGLRPQEIAQLKAEADAADVLQQNAERIVERRKRTAGVGASSRENVDDALSVFEAAKAQSTVKHQSLNVALEGSRKEDIDQAKALAAAREAALATLQLRITESELHAPADGVIQSRILEPGEIADPKKPVLTLALTQPKWVRTYVNEPELGRIRSGMVASLVSDSSSKPYSGWVGFISPVAEFTPKSVETTDLRTSLVYEARIYVNDPDDELRLGMPMTARIDRTKSIDSSSTRPEPVP